ncbi:pyridoxine/pyridoxamine 5'-phosphate oxidase [Echinicola pacifica]|uniref:Pyridoxine/pyridoxamine 5'-phosphate oxidase n=1 Tax=Echinicola pacifica TaxID=346377 RepID=A0A918PPI8_9BACT|nr:pyridoxamine 5'-phosphate oxidase [Echinicola pacifica]GGZ17650.1 pyridoxine/pyridoxamine 5'-phosphate oxidase [Echinicola pacifica]
MELSSIRTDYSLKTLNINGLKESPMEQFAVWMDEALLAQVTEPNAMNLCTVGKDLKPSSRIVLLKGMDVGFIFYTNYNSKKGHQLIENPQASLTFFWPELQRQVRIEGLVEKVNTELSDQYFHSRPLGSQIGAWASPQSQTIPNREFLEEKEAEAKIRFEKEELKRPDHWGGYRLQPDLVEFWQGRSSRLHDRIVYEKMDNQWTKKMLAP